MMIAALYRKIVSPKIRNWVYNAFLGDLLMLIRNPKEGLKCKWNGLHYSVVTPKTEKEQALKIWGKMRLSPYPYLWKKEYDNQDYPVFIDDNNSLPYVIHNEKKLYFRRDMINSVSGAYRGLLIEQDKRSAHRYVETYQELEGKTLLDIGAAEAIFTLDVIEYIDHAYLFECDEAWIEALEATFTQWKEKIAIVRKYISDVNDENSITLDEYFKDKPTNNLFLKMDIEGFERKALKGSQGLLQNVRNISGSVCIYHLHDDEEAIQKVLRKTDLKTIIQPGYLYFEGEMRSAILRFSR